MTTPRRRTPLTPEQKADAARLKAIFLRVRAERRRTGGEPITQDAMAAACGWAGQSAASQYINGGIALNVRAVLKAAAYLGVQPAEISPTLAKEIAAGSKQELTSADFDAADPQQLADLLRLVADAVARLR